MAALWVIMSYGIVDGYLEDEGRVFLQNVGAHLQAHMSP
jgi:hypothetical protein